MDVAKVFAPFITDDLIILAPGISVKVDTFQKLFAEVEEATFEAFTAFDEQHGYGYQEFFEKSRDEGILK